MLCRKRALKGRKQPGLLPHHRLPQLLRSPRTSLALPRRCLPCSSMLYVIALAYPASNEGQSLWPAGLRFTEGTVRATPAPSQLQIMAGFCVECGLQVSPPCCIHRSTRVAPVCTVRMHGHEWYGCEPLYMPPRNVGIVSMPFCVLSYTQCSQA